LRVIELDESTVPALDAYLRKGLYANLYLVYDLQYERKSRATFYIAEEHGSIRGVLLKYRGYPHSLAVILGSDDAVRPLLDNVGVEKMVLLATPELSKVLGEKFPNASKSEVNIMLLDGPAANLIVRHNVIRLGVDDTRVFARSLAYRVGENLEPAEDDVVEARRLLAANAAFGIFDGDLLVSRAISHVRLPEGWAIGGILTDSRYRGRGLATSITSALTQEALRYTNRVVLFVRANNAPAIHIYEKIGFRNIARRTWLDTGNGTSP
jgi:ribosomal protein S18 acetylase RimI-like enzyme